MIAMPRQARPFLTGLGLALLVPSLAAAELRPASGAFAIAEEISFGPTVDPGGGAGDLTRSQITVAAVPGGFAVAWAEEELFQPDVARSAVQGQLVGLDGTLGAKFSASQPDVPGAVRRVACPSVASLGGGFALAWAQDQRDGRDVWLRRFTPQAAADGDPVAHFVAAKSLHDQPWVAGSPTGRSALAWLESRVGAAGKMETIYRAQAFAANGSPATPELELAMVPRQSTLRPAVAVDLAGRFTAARGEFVLAWLDGDHLRALHLGADLAPKGTIVDVDFARPELPLVRGQGVGAALAGSRLLLAWAGDLPGGLCPGNAVRGQMFDLAP